MPRKAVRPRIISTDFDGTLVDGESSFIPEAFFELLAAARESGPVTWVINTGRDWDSLQQGLIEAKTPVWPEWVVVVERDIRRISYGRPFELLEWNERCGLLHKQLFASVQPVWKKIEDFIVSQTGAELVVDVGSPLGIIARTENEADRISQFITPLLKHWPNLVAVRNTVYFRFSHIFYNKGSCLQAISRELRVGPQEIFAIGDHLNDLPMLRTEYAHYVACPGNAVDSVKEAVRAQRGYVAQAECGAGVVEAWRHFFPS